MDSTLTRLSLASTLALATATTPPMTALIQSGYGGADVLRVGTRARPTAGQGEVVVKVHAAGIDRGTWHLMTGRPYLMRIMGFGFRAPKNPVPGLDLAGVVVEVGAGVTRLRVGDAVFGIGKGSFAEYARADEEKLAIVPRGMSFDDAAAVPVSGGTALQAIDAAAVVAGERVLVIGASGGVGTFAVQIARSLGADVTAVCSSAKMEFVRTSLELAADRVVSYADRAFLDGSQRYDVILDVGGNTPLARLRRAMTEQARLVFVGGENGGDWTAGFERQLGALFVAPFTRQRFVILASREHHSFFERVAAFQNVRSIIDRRISLGDVPAALREMEEGRVRGKIVVAVGAS